MKIATAIFIPIISALLLARAVVPVTDDTLEGPVVQGVVLHQHRHPLFSGVQGGALGTTQDLRTPSSSRRKS